MEPNLFDDFHGNSDFTENYTDIWNNNSQVFENELSNNLQGILPLFGNNNLQYDQDQDIVAKICQSEHQYLQATSSPTVEVIQVDPDDYQSDEDDDACTEFTYDPTSDCEDDQEEVEPFLSLGNEVNTNYSESSDDEEPEQMDSNCFEKPQPTSWPASFISIKNSITSIVPKKRVQRKSFSLPESPVHCQNEDIISTISSLTYEDLDFASKSNSSSNSSSNNEHSDSSDSDEEKQKTSMVDIALKIDTVVPRVPPLKLKNLSALSKQNIIQTKLKRQCVKNTAETNFKILSKPNFLYDDSEASDIDVGIEITFGHHLKQQTQLSTNVDNLKSDPTWSPTKLTSTTTNAGDRGGTKDQKKATLKVVIAKQKPVKPPKTPSSTTKSSSLAVKHAPTVNKLLKVNPINVVPKTKVGLLNAAGKYSKNMMNAVTKPLKPTAKLDHDYCTSKKQISSKIKPTIPIVPRKTIVLPFDFKISNHRKQQQRKIQDFNNQRKNNTSSMDNSSTKIIDVEDKTKKILEIVVNDESVVAAVACANEKSIVTTKNGDNLTCDNHTSNAIHNPELNVSSNICDMEMDNSNSWKGKVEPTEELAVKKVTKKKLNLAEYKKRRCIVTETNNKVSQSTKEIKEENQFDSHTQNLAIAEQMVSTFIDETAKTKTFLNVTKNQYEDPISAAQRKALRQRALKKAAIEKSVEDQILKATPLLPILPLSQLTGTESVQDEVVNLAEPKEYEEIIIVSIACNTDVTIPINNATEAIAQLYSTNNIVFDDEASTTQLCPLNGKTSGESVVKISMNSLLSSIQDVVTKKSTMDKPPSSALLTVTTGPSGHISPNVGLSPPNQFSPGKPETSKCENMEKFAAATKPEGELENERDDAHGEDKIIMHLKKDRVMPKLFSVTCQTLTLPQFPLLKRLKPIRFKSNCAGRDRSRRSYRVRRSESRSSDRSNHNRRDQKSSSPECGRRRRYSSRSNSSQHRDSSLQRDRSSRRDRSSHSYHRRSRYERHRTSSTASSASVSTSRSSVSVDGKNKRRRSRYHDYQQQRDQSQKRYHRNCSTSSGSQSSYYSSRSKSKSRSMSPKRQKNTTERTKSPDERRIVYVGRIENELTEEQLKQKFISYGKIKRVTLHFKDSGIRYGFVTFDRPQDAFTAIDASTKDEKINMYDISFGGRRQFCRAQYSDLDGLATHNNSSPVIAAIPYFVPNKEDKKEESFEEMLKKLKAKMSAKNTRQS